MNNVNYAFEPYTCEPCDVTAQSFCDPSECATGGFQWIADMAYDTTREEMCEVAVGGGKEVFCWHPDDCSCGSVHTPQGGWGAVSERGLAYRENDDIFFIGGWESRKITAFLPGGWAVGGPQGVGDTISGPSGLAYDPVNNVLWIANRASANEIYPMDVRGASPWPIGDPVEVPGITSHYALGGADYVDYEGITAIAVLDLTGPAIFFYQVPSESSTTTTTSSTTTSSVVTTTSVTTTSTTPTDDDSVDDDSADDDSAVDDTTTDDDSVADDDVDDDLDDTADDDVIDDDTEDDTADDTAADDAGNDTTSEGSNGCCG